MSSARSGPWLVAVAAVAVATGVVVGQLARGGTDAASPPKGPGPSFQLGQAERPQPGSTGNPAPGELGIMPVMGPIRSVDTGSGAVTVGGQGEIPVQRVRVTPQTLIVRQAPGGAADFKVRDTIVASGAPTALIVREAR